MERSDRTLFPSRDIGRVFRRRIYGMGLLPCLGQALRRGRRSIANSGEAAAWQSFGALQPGYGIEPDGKVGGSGKRICNSKRNHGDAGRKKEYAAGGSQAAVEPCRITFRPVRQKPLQPNEKLHLPLGPRNRSPLATIVPEFHRGRR